MVQLMCPRYPPPSTAAEQVQAISVSAPCPSIVFHGAYRCHFGPLFLVLILLVSTTRMLFASVDLGTIPSRLRLAVCLLLVVALLLFLSS